MAPPTASVTRKRTLPHVEARRLDAADRLKWLLRKHWLFKVSAHHLSSRLLPPTLVALRHSGFSRNELVSYPSAIAFGSRLNSLFRLSFDRESAALDALSSNQQDEVVEYEAMPL